MNGTTVAFAPLLPWAILAPLLGLAALAVLLALFRRARGTWWRALALAALALALVNPSLISERREPIKDVAVVLVDESPSQKVGDRAARAEKALADIQARLAGQDDLELRVARVGGADASLTETRMFEALDRATSDVPRRRLAGAVLITDGQVHDVPGEPPRDRGPIHTLLTGTREEADRRIAVVQAPGFGIVGKEVVITVRVDDMPAAQGPEAVLTVRQDGGTPRPLRVPVGQDQQLTFTVEHGGQNVFEFEVQQAPSELTMANNRAAVVVNGVRDRLRVLLVSGEPHAGERTWRNLLKADPAVDLVHFTILRPPEKQDGTPVRELSLIAFPIRELFEVKLSEFDLVIFDRYQRRGVLPNLYLGNIAEYVRNGGALLEAGGPSFATPLSLFRTPLGEVLPGEPTGQVIEEGFRPVVSGVGRRHPVTAGLPGDSPDGQPSWGRWLRQVEVIADRGQVVMEGAEGRPLMILDRVGKGRVAQLMSDHVWLWSRGFEGGGPQAELLRRLAHWLMKEPELEENDLRAKVDGNRITIERRSLQPDPRGIELTTPSGRTEAVALQDNGSGADVATVLAQEPGIYRVTDGERTALAVVGAANPPELADMRTTEERMRPVAEATGGGMLWLADLSGLDIRRTRPDRDQSGRSWIGLRANGDHVVTGISETPLVPGGLVLLLVLGGLLAAWRREGR
ncbi:hypothetical protein [Arenibaculum pallidiluteum]|uniref:hypothetical protein n=1 Tax=Arenibaculum pallidiluteum TaxID=2812559 RepID=UPI001A97CD4C|nr:hypothetical protein [Arenibaculum pallidiluteum]